MNDSRTWTSQQAFRFLDRNQDGMIDTHDLTAACSDLAFSTALLQSNPPANVTWSYAQFRSLLDRHAMPTTVDEQHLGQIVELLHTSSPLDFKVDETLQHLVAGGMAGAVSRTVVSPIERVKILFQVQGDQAARRGVVATLRTMWREEGVRGLLRGNGTNVIRIVPYSASQFASYECFRSWLSDTQGNLDTVRRLTAGAGAGVVSVACTYPLDMVRTRLSIQSASATRRAPLLSSSSLSSSLSSAKTPLSPSPSPSPSPTPLPGIGATLVTIYRNEGGLAGLYRGIWPTTLGVAPYVALNFQFYDVLKTSFLPYVASSSTLTALGQLVCGSVAGSMAQTIIYPLDVLRRRMHVAGMPNSPYKYNGAWDAVRTMVKHEGPKSLFRGLTTNYLKVAPAMGVSFVTYETCKDLMQR